MHAVIVCGVGKFGADAARRIEREQPDAARYVVAEGSPIDARAVADRVLDAARRLLAHERMVVRRDVPGEDGLTELLVVVIASVGEPPVRAALADTVSSIETRLLGELRPMFEPHRTGHARNAILLPLLVMPHPTGHPEGTDMARTIREWVSRIQAQPSEQRCTPQIFLVEDVAEFSILSEHELQQNVRNFVTMLLGARGALRDRMTVLYGRNLSEPLATFACAVAELPRFALARWATNRVALELLDAVLDAKQESATLTELDALEGIELDKLDLGVDPGLRVRELLDRYFPAIESDAPPRWWESADVVRERYGPDAGDPSVDDFQPQPDPPRGFALERMRSIEDAWRRLQRLRFDDLVAQERAKLEEARDAMVARIRARIDRELWSRPSPEALRRTSELVDKLRRAIGIEIEQALAARDAIRPAVAPSFEGFRAAHDRLLDHARRKPDPAVLLLWMGLAVLGAIALGPTLLSALADGYGLGAGTFYEPLVREYASITSAALAMLVVGGWFGWHCDSRHRALVAAHAAMWRALDAAVNGESGSFGTSVLQYFASRLRLARCTARVEALLAVRAALDRDAESLELADRAARRARSLILEDQRKLGALGKDGRDSLTGLLAGRGETLVEPLVGPEAAASIERQMPPDSRQARISDTFRTLADREAWARRWREEGLFSSIDALRAAAELQARGAALWDPFAIGEDAEATAQRIAAFIRRQARSLHVALELSGPESSPNETHAFSRGIAIVPPAAFETVRRLLAEEGAAGRSILCEPGTESDRAYYLVVVTDVAIERVGSLRAPGGSGAASPAMPPPRFDVELPSERARGLGLDEETQKP